METSPVLRRVIFGALVCALVGLGAYLIGPVAHRARAASTASPATSAPAAPAVSRSSAAPSSPGGGAKGGTTADIYQWLPFSQAGLAAAASVVVQFGNAYGSYSYTQTGAEYVAPLQTVTTGQLAGQIEQAFSAPGVAAARSGAKQVSAGTTTIESIRAFGTSSITFVAQVNQQLTGSAGRSVQSPVYAITVTGNGTSWLVSDVELATAGNT
jgi:hypothetical protein